MNGNIFVDDLLMPPVFGRQGEGNGVCSGVKGDIGVTDSLYRCRRIDMERTCLLEQGVASM